MADRPLALITGGSSGIGAEFAHQLAARGYDLILVARRAGRLEALADGLRQAYGGAVEPLAADLSSDAGMGTVESRISAAPALALLVNNAGFSVSGALAQAASQDQRDMLNVHVVAAMRLTHAALPGMVARRAGGIINLASLAAFMVLPGNVNYCATKAYLLSFSRGVAAEVRRHGVKVQALCPGFTITEFHDEPGRPGAGRARIPGFLFGPVRPVVADSLRALERGQVVCVPGAVNRGIVLLARLGLVDLLAPRLLSG